MKKIDKYETIQSKGIVLNANESDKNISEEIREQIAERIKVMEFNRYPEDSSQKLIQAYAKYINKKETQIIAGNGSDEMLGLLIGLSIKENKKLYTLSLDFSMYDYYCSMHNGEVLKYDCNIDKEFDVDEFIKLGKQNNVDLILFSNPNNPTGRVIKQVELCQIIKSFPDIYVVIDEAYADFDSTTMLDFIEECPNLLVTRTLSKAFALAAIRCGFLIGNENTIATIAKSKVPYNVNSMSQIAAEVVLENSCEIHKNIDMIKLERETLYNECLKLNRKDIILYPSKTNYLYGVCKNKKALMKQFNKYNIIVRNYNDDSFRITVGSSQQNKLVLEILRTF